MTSAGRTSERERARRVLEPEVAVRDEPAGDPLAVRPVERDVGHRLAEELPGDGDRDGDRDEDAGCGERGRVRAVAHGPTDVLAGRRRGANSASSANGSTQGR